MRLPRPSLFALLLALLPPFLGCQAEAQTVAPQKLIFLPDSLRPYDLTAPASRWSWRHSAQTENLVFFWERGFGDDPSCPPPLDGHPMAFDIGNLQTRVERFYRYFRDTLAFTLPGSKADRYKMMVMVNYSLDGTAYGGTYDDFIGALWVAPNRIQDRKLNCLAHELGHSFQLQIMADSVGEAWGGSGFFEMTSQWMLWRVNPDWPTDEQYHLDAFRTLTHKGFLSLDNIYHSPYVIEWWAERHGLKSIAELYRQGRIGEDPVMTYKRMYGLSQKQFNDEMFDCYRHLVNFDFTYARPNTRKFAGSFSTPMVSDHGTLRPDTARQLENYGFHVIPLKVPAPGKAVKLSFRGTMGNQYRYGFVAVTEDGRCIYSPAYHKSRATISFRPPLEAPVPPASPVAPASLYLVVMGAPATHDQDPASRKFPYSITILK